MKNEDIGKNFIRRFYEGRAARVCAVAVSVFLCVFSLFEVAVLVLGWELPITKAFGTNAEAVFSADVTGGQSPGEATLALEDTGASLSGASQPETTEASDTEVPGENQTEGTGSSQMEASGEPETEIAEETEETEESEKPEFPYYIRVNRKQNCITVYTMDEEGEYTVPHKAIVCSTGLYNATPKGVFQLSDKYTWRQLNGGVYGQYASRITGNVLFHSVPYYTRNKGNLCTDKYNKLGQQASAGCIRLTVEDAKWILENCPSGTVVEIYDADDPGPLGKPEALKIDSDNPNKGWDPTDPDEKNPWNQVSEDS